MGLVCAVLAVVLSSCSDEPSSTVASGSSGEALYQASCASCHGSDLRGTDQGPPHLSQVYAPDHHPDTSFRAAISQGARAHHWDFGDMPPVEGVTDRDIAKIVAYVRSLQRANGIK